MLRDAHERPEEVLVYRAKDEEEAIRLANHTPFGLGSYVMTQDPDQALRVADKIDAGMVFINGLNATRAELPFGGVKRSGYGRELGRYGVDEFVNKKLIRIVGLRRRLLERRAGRLEPITHACVIQRPPGYEPMDPGGR